MALNSTALPAIGKAKTIRSASALRYDKVPPEDVRIETTFLNGFRVPIKLIFRNGLTLHIPVNPAGMMHLQGQLQVRKDYRHRPYVKNDMKPLFDVTANSADIEKAELSKAIEAGVRLGNLNGMVSTLMDYLIDVETLIRARTGIYIPELDVVISSHVEVETFHPHSKAGETMAAYQDIPENNFNYRIEIIDPDDKIGYRFINVAGKVYRINANKRVDKLPGVYLYSTCADGACEQMYNFTDADAALKMFRTADEASVYGDLADERKRMHQEKQHELEQVAHANKIEAMEIAIAHEREKAKFREEHERLSGDFKLASLERDRQKAEIDHLRDVVKHHMELNAIREKEKYEQRSHERKDRYDERSSSRKDYTEYVKYLPIALIGIGLIAAKIAEHSKTVATVAAVAAMV